MFQPYLHTIESIDTEKIIFFMQFIFQKQLLPLTNEQRTYIRTQWTSNQGAFIAIYVCDNRIHDTQRNVDQQKYYIYYYSTRAF